MRAGALRHFVAIEAATESQNSFGEAVPTWGTVATTWAEITNVSAREQFRAEQMQGQIIATARMRYIAGISPKMRLVFDGRRYLIRGVAPIKGVHRELELTLEEYPDG